MHSDGIGNYLELKRNNENKDACIISLFETIFETAMRKSVQVVITGSLT